MKSAAIAKHPWHEPGEYRALVIQHFAEQMDLVLNCCESPLEQALLLAMMLAFPYAHWVEDDQTTHCCPNNVPFGEAGDVTEGEDGVFLYNQFELETSRGKRYRLDFAILVPWHRRKKAPGLKLAVEVDGHNFHERTQEQAERDRSRDRELIADGWLPLRFTGSEVWRNATACATELRDLLWPRFVEAKALAKQRLEKTATQ